jgi:GLPGLI family protein
MIHYTNYNKKGILTVIYYGKYIYEEPVPKFEWKIKPDTTTILGYKCIKATTTFRGRDYEAWFTPFIPVRQGPWKFNGLPGLILKVADTKEYFKWEAIGIEKPENRKIYTYNIDKSEIQKITREDMMKLLHKQWQDPLGQIFLQNEKMQTIRYKDPTTGKLIWVNRGDTYNYQKPYIPIPELE